MKRQRIVAATVRKMTKFFPIFLLLFSVIFSVQ